MSFKSTDQIPMTRRHMLRLGAGACAGGLALVGGGGFYSRYAEPAWLDVTHTAVPIVGLGDALQGLRIALISDLHAGPFMKPERFARAVQAINAQSPDLGILAGDFVTSHASNIDPYIELFGGISAPLGIYAVLGNHDVWTDPNRISQSIESVGIRVLRNEQISLQVGDHTLLLTGVLDSGFVTHDRSSLPSLWESTLASLPVLPPKEAHRTHLLLVHNPDVNELLPAGSVDLSLSGHTHGGQVQLPFDLGPLYLPSCMGTRYAGGLVDAPVGPVYVTRGLGMSGLPIRLNCRPEIAMLTLERA